MHRMHQVAERDPGLSNQGTEERSMPNCEWPVRALGVGPSRFVGFRRGMGQ